VREAVQAFIMRAGIVVEVTRAECLWLSIFNFRFDLQETGSTWRRDRFA